MKQIFRIWIAALSFGHIRVSYMAELHVQLAANDCSTSWSMGSFIRFDWVMSWPETTCSAWLIALICHKCVYSHYHIPWYVYVYSCQSRVLTNLNWVHFDQKCCAARSRWDENGSATRQCEQWVPASPCIEQCPHLGISQSKQLEHGSISIRYGFISTFLCLILGCWHSGGYTTCV